jgi:uncharacterized protein YrrD
MQFKENAHVYSADKHDVGRITRVVMDPVSNKVTHVVVRQGLIFTEDKLIPMSFFQSATPERAMLRKEIEDLDDLPQFEETDYLPVDSKDAEQDGAIQPLFWYPPLAAQPYHATGFYGTPLVSTTYEEDFMPGRHYVKRTTQNIPEDTIALEEGAKVISADGEHVGDIERLHIDPQSHYATHALISQGLLLPEKKWIPTLWFSTMSEGKVYLAVNADMLERLPKAENA